MSSRPPPGKLDPNGLVNPNRYGESPFIASDPARPNAKYFEHIDWVVDRAAHYRICVVLLPVGGQIFFSGVQLRWGGGGSC